MTNIPSSAKLQKSPETPNKPSDKPASPFKRCGVDLFVMNAKISSES